jgi:hypothetical protein
LKKKTLFCIIFLVVFFVFQNGIINWYDKHIVIPFFSSIQDSDKLYFIFVFLILLTISYAIDFVIENRRIKSEFAILAAFFLISYIGYRYASIRYIYLESKYTPGIKYLDYFILLLATIVILKIREIILPEKEPIYGSQPFLMDLPIISSSSDKFGRKNFAKLMALKIQSRLDVNNAGALAIGINGSWGSGKTSFVNLIKQHIDYDKRIIIDFNPWRSSSPTKIIEDFFEILIKEMSEYDSQLKNNMIEYAKTLTKINESSITREIKNLTESLFDSESKNEYYNRINQSLIKIKKQIIIFIDDLDRLDKYEIIEVLRIVRNTANFDNIVYIVSYDKGYVLEAVKKFNAYNFKTFLEKIFQFEFSLPKYDAAILRNGLKRILTEKLEPIFGPMISAAVDYVNIQGRNLTNEVILTYRDVIRLSNSFLFEFEHIKNEVNLVDFYFIQLVKVKFFNVYAIISENKYRYFIKDGNVIRLRKISEEYTEITDFDKYLENEIGNRSNIEKSSDDNYILENFIRSFRSDELTDFEKNAIIQFLRNWSRKKIIV